VQKCRHGNVVREVGNQRGRLIEEIRLLKGKDVGVEDTQPMNLAVGVARDRLG